jgi:hypothetical protein
LIIGKIQGHAKEISYHGTELVNLLERLKEEKDR